jgi:hypothetical protein
MMMLRGCLAFAFVVLACGGETTVIDGGTDAAKKVPCWGDPRTTTNRQCTSNADCAIVDHVADCCGSIVEDGVRVDQVNAVHNAETSANAGCNVCQCMAQPTVDENGGTGGAYLAKCDPSGLCTAYAQ